MKITIVGPYPPPFGGISVHIKRMKNYLRYKDVNCCIYNESKWSSFEDKIFTFQSNWKLIFKIFFTKSDLIHFHSVNIKFRILLGINRILGKKIILTIHGESLNRQIRESNIFIKFLLLKSLKKIDKIICVNSNHVNQLIRLGIKKEKISYIPAYITPVEEKNDLKKIDEDVWDFVSSKKFLICANGWVRFYNNEDLYGFDLLLSLIKRLQHNSIDANLIISLLGVEKLTKEGREYYKKLKKMIIENKLQDKIFIYEVKNTEFYPILKKSHLFIRPTNIDGYGVSIAEAIHYNILAIASNVCKRPEGTVLFNTRDMEDLYNKTIDVINNYDKHKKKIKDIRFEDNAEKLLSIYHNVINKSPNWIQKPIKSIYFKIPYERRLGQKFKSTYSFLQESQWWSKKQHEEYQMIQIQKLLKHAYVNVPYYTKIFNERGLKPNSIQNFNDLKQLPYLTKQIINKNLDKLIAKNYSKKSLSYVTTGGTTGVPMGFYQDKKNSNAIEWAFMTNQWSRVGYDVYEMNRCVIIRGDIPKNSLYEFKGYNLILSSYQLTEDNMEMYIKLIEKFDPDFIQAYPSSINILADFILKNNKDIKLNKIKAVLCGSENLYDFQRVKINKAFKVRVYSWYGHSEQSCLAGECEGSNYYHIFNEYGYTELNNDCNGQAKKEGDIAVNTNDICKCGRNYRLIKRIDGRKQEIIITKDGTKVMLTGLYKMFDKVSNYIEQGQFYQDKHGILELRLVKKILIMI